MKRMMALGISAGVASLAMVFAGAPAQAAHCDDRGMPGNSDFASHVRDTNGPGAHNEGDHQGWSSCEEQAKSGGR